MFRFNDPYFLWLLLLLPLIAVWRGRKGKSAAVEFSSTHLIRQISKEHPSSAGAWLQTVRLLALGLIILGLARPQWGKGKTEVQASGIDIVLALDISGSMQALDFTLNGRQADRLAVVKSVVAKFIESRPNDRLAIVVFAGRPYLISPLTLDHDWLLRNLEDRVYVGLVEDSTAIGTAIAMSVNRLRDQPSKSKVIILLTDGNNNAGKVSPETAAEAARALGVKVYTIAVGTEGMAPIPAMDQFGQRQIVQMKVDVDEATLQKIASITDGMFYRATDTGSLERVYKEIDRLEKTTVTMKKYENYRELFHFFVTAAIALIGFEFLMSQTRYRRLP